MLEARINSGKTASTSAPAANGKRGIENDSIFADLDTDGTESVVSSVLTQLIAGPVKDALYLTACCVFFILVGPCDMLEGIAAAFIAVHTCLSVCIPSKECTSVLHFFCLTLCIQGQCL